MSELPITDPDGKVSLLKGVEILSEDELKELLAAIRQDGTIGTFITTENTKFCQILQQSNIQMSRLEVVQHAVAIYEPEDRRTPMLRILHIMALIAEHIHISVPKWAKIGEEHENYLCFTPFDIMEKHEHMDFYLWLNSLASINHIYYLIMVCRIHISRAEFSQIMQDILPEAKYYAKLNVVGIDLSTIDLRVNLEEPITRAFPAEIIVEHFRTEANQANLANKENPHP